MTTLTKQDLDQLCGDVVRYRHPLNRKIIYTPGVKHVAESGDAYWLVDAITFWMTSQDYLHATAYDERLCYMVFWTLEVKDDKSAVLTGRADSDAKAAFTQHVPYTDFPLSKIDIWAATDGQHWTLYLPSEH
ncbi:MAG: hypothetical protein Aurels2KO_53820 [Aureliella sp.]